jgi:hypothetical protein
LPSLLEPSEQTRWIPVSIEHEPEGLLAGVSFEGSEYPLQVFAHRLFVLQTLGHRPVQMDGAAFLPSNEGSGFEGRRKMQFCEGFRFYYEVNPNESHSKLLEEILQMVISLAFKSVPGETLFMPQWVYDLVEQHPELQTRKEVQDYVEQPSRIPSIVSPQSKASESGPEKLFERLTSLKRLVPLWLGAFSLLLALAYPPWVQTTNGVQESRGYSWFWQPVAPTASDEMHEYVENIPKLRSGLEQVFGHGSDTNDALLQSISKNMGELGAKLESQSISIDYGKLAIELTMILVITWLCFSILSALKRI